MVLITKQDFEEIIDCVWDASIDGICSTISALTYYVGEDPEDIEDTEDIDSEEFYESHIGDGISYFTIHSLMEEWNSGLCSIKTICEFLENYLENENEQLTLGDERLIAEMEMELDEEEEEEEDDEEVEDYSQMRMADLGCSDEL